MNRVLSVILLGYLGIIVLLVFFIDMGEGSDDHRPVVNHRPKRFLSFPNITRFFVRLNFKANMVEWNQIFAQALGFRMNFDDPPDSFHIHHRISRRNLYSNIEILLDRNGLSGLHCLRRAICEVNTIKKPNGIYQRILKIVFRRQSPATDKWHGPASPECELSTTHCPFSFFDVALYTDI